jgi:hypothetical protein
MLHLSLKMPSASRLIKAEGEIEASEFDFGTFRTHH